MKTHTLSTAIAAVLLTALTCAVERNSLTKEEHPIQLGGSPAGKGGKSQHPCHHGRRQID